jgi:hypothetical protein
MTDAYRFLRSLEQHLNEALPGPREVATNIAEIVRTSKASRTNLHKSFPEGALLNHYVLPAIHHFVSQLDGMGSDRARESLLSESYREMREYASGTPARLSRHPFEKVIGASAQSVVRRWKSAKPTVKSYPDLALRAPCPHRTVFEGKYFGGVPIVVEKPSRWTEPHRFSLTRLRSCRRTLSFPTRVFAGCIGLPDVGRCLLSLHTVKP